MSDKGTHTDYIHLRPMATPMATRETVKLGVLALQGGFAEHVAMLEGERDVRAAAGVRLTVEEVRYPEQLAGLDGLVIPGGESTTLGVFLRQNGFVERLRAFAREGERPGCVWGTCAGLILLSEQLDSQKVGGQATIGGIDIQVTRNAYGKQIHSFEATLKLKDPTLFRQATPTGHAHQASDECLGVFIRAPGIVSLTSDLVRPLATLDRGTGEGERVVGVRQGNLMATTFHPELTSDPRWHAYFVDMVMANKYPAVPW